MIMIYEILQFSTTKIGIRLEALGECFMYGDGWDVVDRPTPKGFVQIQKTNQGNLLVSYIYDGQYLTFL